MSTRAISNGRYRFVYFESCNRVKNIIGTTSRPRRVPDTISSMICHFFFFFLHSSCSKTYINTFIHIHLTIAIVCRLAIPNVKQLSRITVRFFLSRFSCIELTIIFSVYSAARLHTILYSLYTIILRKSVPFQLSGGTVS